MVLWFADAREAAASNSTATVDDGRAIIPCALLRSASLARFGAQEADRLGTPCESDIDVESELDPVSLCNRANSLINFTADQQTPTGQGATSEAKLICMVLL